MSGKKERGYHSVHWDGQNDGGRQVSTGLYFIMFRSNQFRFVKKAVLLRKHMETNKKDSTSKRGLELLESKIRRLGKYYVKTRKLAVGWKYNADELIYKWTSFDFHR